MSTNQSFATIVRLAIVVMLVGAVNIASAQTTSQYQAIGNPLGNYDTVAQVSSHTNALYVEYRGTGGLYSVNLERKMSTNLHLRVGAAIIPHLNYSVVNEQLPEYRSVLRDSSTTVVGLAMLSYVPKVFGVDVELSGGGVMTSQMKAFPTAMAGLRFHPFSQRILTRVGYGVSFPSGFASPAGAYSLAVGVQF